MLAVAGVAVLTMDGDGTATPLGDTLVLLAGLAAAGSVILTARLVRRVPPLALTTAQFAIGLAVVLPFSVAAWLSGTEQPLPREPGLAPITALLLTGCLGTAGAFMIYNWALARVSATTAGASVTLIPVFALALSSVVLGESIGVRALVSVALILTGLAAFTVAQRSPREQRPEPGRVSDGATGFTPPIGCRAEQG